MTCCCERNTSTRTEQETYFQFIHDISLLIEMQGDGWKAGFHDVVFFILPAFSKLVCPHTRTREREWQTGEWEPRRCSSGKQEMMIPGRERWK